MNRSGLSILLAMVVLLLAMLSVCCNGSDGGQAPSVDDNDLWVTTFDGEKAVKVKPLDDDSNPYKGMYRDWDIWTYENAVLVKTEFPIGKYPDDFTCLGGHVDENGYLVPRLEYERQYQEAIKTGDTAAFSDMYYTICGEGKYDQDKLDQQHREVRMVQAPFYPAIPAWLAENPPVDCILYPNGDIITRGKLGSDAEARASNDPGGMNLPWYRYTRDGELAGSDATIWWDFYLDEDVFRHMEGEPEARANGYLIFKDAKTGETLSVYDYDGTKRPDNDTPLRDKHPFYGLKAKVLVELYECQQTTGSHFVFETS